MKNIITSALLVFTTASAFVTQAPKKSSGVVSKKDTSLNYLGGRYGYDSYEDFGYAGYGGRGNPYGAQDWFFEDPVNMREQIDQVRDIKREINQVKRARQNVARERYGGRGLVVTAVDMVTRAGTTIMATVGAMADLAAEITDMAVTEEAMAEDMEVMDVTVIMVTEDMAEAMDVTVIMEVVTEGMVGGMEATEDMAEVITEEMVTEDMAEDMEGTAAVMEDMEGT
eukprot:CAMPEP_0116061370 /NCGR_PEP_ID=MMETSP0322-20121206/7044_1 /TAXON_ID=163516 /ORGANISM="Leptocylindrus danicus var. apora, Strain B651" /LENGTH=225 /DNA_ID=CAMNT_0003546315 /DNA_START=40 /DNA_END=714 /DNA_ORIENTATION=-